MKRILTGLLALSLIFGGMLYAQQGGIIFGGGNVTQIINPSSSGTHTLKTGGATIAVDSKGFQIISTGTQPACDATTRDYFWLQRGGTGTPDTREVCSKGTGDIYSWKSILSGAASSLQAAFDVGKTIANANSFANGMHVGASATTGTRVYEHATLGPQIVPVCAGIENDCDKKVNLNAAKTWELQSQAVAKARFTESTGVLEAVGTGQVKANRTTCTGTDYLKADGTCAAPGTTDIATTMEIREDFMGGSGVSGNIGEINWSFGAGTFSAVAAEAGRPGIVNMASGAVLGNEANLVLGPNSGATSFLASDTFDATFIVRVNTITVADMRFGVMSHFTGVPTDGAYLEKLQADTNWFCVTRAANVETRTNTTVAVAAAFVKLRVRRTSGTNIACNVGAGADVNNTTNLPTAAVLPVHYIKTNEAVAKNFGVDAFYMKITGLSR